MINIRSIREKPPAVDPEAALQVLAYLKAELMKDPTRCLTATKRTHNLMMHYEETCKA